MIKNKRRFIDSSIWIDEWFEELNDGHRLFWFFLITACDVAGIWKTSFREAEFCIKKQLSRNNVEEAFAEQIIIISSKKWFIKNFPKYQYTEQLNLSNSAVRVAVKEMLKNGISEETLRELDYSFCYTEKGSKRIYQLSNIQDHFTRNTTF